MAATVIPDTDTIFSSFDYSSELAVWSGLLFMRPFLQHCLKCSCYMSIGVYISIFVKILWKQRGIPHPIVELKWLA